MKKHSSRGFTLIELLIVVAIIAILAAIAVPNFLEAQTRSKVARVKADMRTTSIALESFSIDHNCYPPNPTSANQDYGLSESAFNSRFKATWGITYQDMQQNNLPNANFWYIQSSFFLTTPIAYLTTIPSDPFTIKNTIYPGGDVYGQWKDTNPGEGKVIPNDVTQGFNSVDGKTRFFWYIQSFGPDMFSNDDETHFPSGVKPGESLIPYDPTNGTVSWGDIFRAGP